MIEPVPTGSPPRPQGPPTIRAAVTFVGLIAAVILAVDYPLVSVAIVASLIAGPRLVTGIRRRIPPVLALITNPERPTRRSPERTFQEPEQRRSD